MSQSQPQTTLEKELAVIENVADKGPLQKFFAYAKLSGPGWLQGAITLGGGSLAGALYLGVISGYGLMWLQPLAMICGIIMLSAISYVTLSTEARPFHAINRHLSPLLGWSWLIATVMANIVWTMPQFALGTAAIQQNLFSESIPTPVIIVAFFLIGLFVNHLYQSGGKSAKTFDLIIKVMVGIIVLSFFAVVVTLSTSGAIPWGQIFAGLIPNFSLLFSPADGFSELIANSSNPEHWTKTIANQQRNIIIAAFGTAVGINMTWLLPYSLLKKRWGKKHRGLSIVDLSIGLFVPFFLATSCVVIASAASFHRKTDDLRLENGDFKPAVVAQIDASVSALEKPNSSDRELAAILIKRDAGALAVTLEPLAGPVISQKIFGIGVLGMAVSTIIILMLINGLAFQEILTPADSKSPPSDNKSAYYIGCIISGLAGCMFPILWAGKAKAALAVPTSVIGGSLLPIAYFTFLLLMNSKSILGDKRPEGGTRILWNLLMGFATAIATLGSVWVLWGKKDAPGWQGAIGWGGLAFLVILFLVGTISFLKKEKASS